METFIGLVLFVASAYGMYRWVMYRKSLRADHVVGKGGGSSDDSPKQKK